MPGGQLLEPLEVGGQMKQQPVISADAPLLIHSDDSIHGAPSLNGHRDLVLEGLGVVPLQREAVAGELIEIRHGRIDAELRRGTLVLLQQLFDDGHMAVVDMSVGDNMDKLARLQPRHLRHHVYQHAVLHHVPVVCRQHILAALVQNGVEGVAGESGSALRGLRPPPAERSHRGFFPARCCPAAAMPCTAFLFCALTNRQMAPAIIIIIPV